MQMNITGSSGSPDAGYVQGVAYAPADFPDIDGLESRQSQQITNTVNHVSLYHIADSYDKAQQFKAWKRKIRDIIVNHEERILQFFTKSLSPEHPFRAAHILLQKYGKNPPLPTFDPGRNPGQTLKDCVVDLSGQGIAELNKFIGDIERLRANELPQTRWMNMTKQLLDYMRDVGDELIRIDQKLKDECFLLDTVVEKSVQILRLPNPDLPDFQKMMELFIEKQFEKHPIEEHYWNYVYTLQKYSALRDILMPQRMGQAATEPLCCICMNEPVVIAFVPCGHTFCTNCSKRTMICHVCRQMITNRVRLYFG